MKKELIIGVCILLFFVTGCSSYEDCFEDCAEVECGYDKSIRASYNSDEPCYGQVGDYTIEEYCYKECKPK